MLTFLVVLGGGVLAAMAVDALRIEQPAPTPGFPVL